MDASRSGSGARQGGCRLGHAAVAKFRLHDHLRANYADELRHAIDISEVGLVMIPVFL